MSVWAKFLEWMENKGYHLMTVFIVLQILIFVVLILIYFFAQGKMTDLYYNIYSWSVVCLFMVFMIHFAYHSVIYILITKKIRRAYFIELIAFLLMSTLSSGLLIFYFFAYVINNDSLTHNLKHLCTIIGIVSVILLIMGNIIYFISAYFAYGHFELIFLNKFGAKLIYHKIFSWMQFQHSMMKSDLGLIVFLLITTFVFDNANVALVVIDSLYLPTSILIVIFMRHSIRSENKRLTVSILGVRIFLEAYKIFRIFYLFDIDDATSHIKKDFIYKFTYGFYSVIAAMIFDEAIFVLIIISTVKCILNFEKGFKEMLDKQRQVDDIGTSRLDFFYKGDL